MADAEKAAAELSTRDCLFERLQKAEDVNIGGDVYRACPMELKIKYCGKGHGWKTLQKFESVEEMARYWDSLTAPGGSRPGKPLCDIVVRECVEADKVLPPEAATPYTPDAVTAQYRRAVAGALEMVRFGAMLVEIDMALSAGGQDPNGRRGEESLHGWLEANCPDVNYKTAMRFKCLAEGVQRSCNVPAKVPLSLAMPGPDGEPVMPPEGQSPIPHGKLKKIQQEVWALVEGKSARQLQFAFAADEAAPKGGANHTKKLSEEEQHEAMVKAANAVWNTNVEALVDQVKRIKSHMLLTGDTVGKLLTKLGIVSDALNAAASTKE